MKTTSERPRDAKLEALAALLAHPDPDTQRQGVELGLALGADATRPLFEGRTDAASAWRAPPEGVGPALLVLALTSERRAWRESVRALPPLVLEAEGLAALGRGFPRLTRLEAALVGDAPALAPLGALPLEELWLAPVSGALDLAPLASLPLRSLTLTGAFPGAAAPLPEGLEALRIDARSPLHDWLALAPPTLSTLSLSAHWRPDRMDDLGRFRALRALRVGHLPRGVLDRPLEHLHVGDAHGDAPLALEALGPASTLRVDDWFEPTEALAGDPRIRHVGPMEEDVDTWRALFERLPGLEVVHTYRRYGLPPVALALPPGALPAPEALWRLDGQRWLGVPKAPLPPWCASDAARGAIVAAWAERGRATRLELAAGERVPRLVGAVKRLRDALALSLAEAKTRLDALRAGGLVALRPREARRLQVLLATAGVRTVVREPG